jgi:hypothetical protein
MFHKCTPFMEEGKEAFGYWLLAIGFWLAGGCSEIYSQ